MGQSNVAAGRTQSGTPYKYHGQVSQVVSISSICFENIDFLPALSHLSPLSLSLIMITFLKVLTVFVTCWPPTSLSVVDEAQMAFFRRCREVGKGCGWDKKSILLQKMIFFYLFFFQHLEWRINCNSVLNSFQTCCSYRYHSVSLCLPCVFYLHHIQAMRISCDVSN